MWRKILMGLAALLILVGLGVGAFVFIQARAFDQSMAKIYDVPLPVVHRSTSPEVLTRGKHLAYSLGACTTCHGENLAGGREEPLGPLGKMIIPNITTGKGGRGAKYSDGEMARLVRHGIKKSGKSVHLMPSQDTAWWPDQDLSALISYIRSVPPVDGDPGITEWSAMAKVLDRFDSIPIDVARRIPHQALPKAPEPAPTAKYGAFVGTSCRGCHAETLAGGPIPGGPPDLAVPLNITPHETGLKGWTYEDFTTLIETGKRKNGKVLDPFMPVDALRNYDEVERRALWEYLKSVPPRPFGQRTES